MSYRKIYEEQLQMLHKELVEMGNLCTEAVQLAVQAVSTGEEALVQRTVEIDELIDKQERDIESLCLKLLLQQQPVATDLRRISSALKMISDLERIGDQASDIAEISRTVAIQEGTAAKDLYALSAEVIKMVNESVIAFIRNDLSLARQVVSWDTKADAWFVQIKDDLIAEISEDNTQGGYCLDILMAAKYLERIGDHAAIVAEWVEYSILGHHAEEDKIRALD